MYPDFVLLSLHLIWLIVSNGSPTQTWFIYHLKNMAFKSILGFELPTTKVFLPLLRRCVVGCLCSTFPLCTNDFFTPSDKPSVRDFDKTTAFGSSQSQIWRCLLQSWTRHVRIFPVLTQYHFSTSETELDYCH